MGPSNDQSGSVNKDELVAPYLQAMAKFRADIRNAMRQTEKDNLNKTIMELCDELRDVRLVDLGVRLEDKTDETGNPIIKLADKETLIKERDEKALMKAQAAEKKRLAAEKN